MHLNCSQLISRVRKSFVSVKGMDTKNKYDGGLLWNCVE